MNYKAQRAAGMKTGVSLFMVAWVTILVLIVAVWVLVGTVLFKGASCAMDTQCLEGAGHHVGSFVKGVQDGAQGK